MRSERRPTRLARAYVRRAYRDPDLTLDRVARQVGVSARTLQRWFQEEGAESFRDFLLGVRMSQAMRLLTRAKNPLPVRVVARRVGYRQAGGLRQAFARFYGYNPSDVQPAAPEYLGSVIAPNH